MKTFIVLLRGINVSGQKKVKMVDLSECLVQAGFNDVETYIQSGNIICGKEDLDTRSLEIEIQDLISGHFGFEVPVMAFTEEELSLILAQNPFALEEEKSLYFVLLKDGPSQELVDSFNELQYENEEFHITNACVYLCCKAGYGKAKLNNNLIERKLRVQATTRNLRTMKKLLEMAKA